LTSLIPAPPLLDIKNLSVIFPMHGRAPIEAVNEVSFDIGAGEAVGVVGESGSGKSVTSYSIMGLLAKPGRIIGGEIVFDGRNLLDLKQRELEKLRGSRIGMVFQNPMASLNPAFTIGGQLAEALLCHTKISKSDARAKAELMLSSVGITDVKRRMSQYPHELSGGMLQRTMIAMALICGPDLLIADEPTTGLDVTIQAQVLSLMKDLRANIGLSILFVTHNMGIVADLCEKVVVMYSGKVLERGAVEDIFYEPAHPYTRGLLKAIPRIDQPKDERLTPIEGSSPNINDKAAGCVFQSRCPERLPLCAEQPPPEKTVNGSHRSRCWKI